MNGMYEQIKEFGRNVLDYLVSNSSSGDTILFAVDDDVYISLLGEQKVLFEQEIKNYVARNGLDYNHDANIAIALAAHQVKLGYDSRNSFDDIDNNSRKKPINEVLLDFYYPTKTGPLVLYQKYYNSLYNDGENLQDKLWKKVRSVLENEYDRHCVIPVGLKGKNREQKYINAQLITLRALKNSLIRVFYFNGISKDILYSRETFEERISKNLDIDNSSLLKNMLDEIVARLRKYASEDDRISFNYDLKILIGQLYSFYRAWDGSAPIFDLSKDRSGLPNNFFYVELFDEDDENPAEYEFQERILPDMTGLKDYLGVYYRVFTHLYDWTWKTEAVNYPIPDYDPYVLLIEEQYLKYFSEKNRTVYRSKDYPFYLILKYDRKSDDFYANFPATAKHIENKELIIVGGIKLSRNEFLDLGKEELTPSILNSKDCHKKEVDFKIYKSVEIIGNDEKSIAKYRLIKPIVSDISRGCSLVWENLSINGLCIPTKPKAVVKVVKKFNSDVPDFIFQTDLDFKKHKSFIPYEDLKIEVGDGEFVKLDDIEGLSEKDMERLKRGVSFGWFAEDNNEELIKNRIHIKTIRFKLQTTPGQTLFF